MAQIEVLDGPSTCMNLAAVAMREAAGFALPQLFEDMAVGVRGDDGSGFVGFVLSRFRVDPLDSLTTPAALYKGCARYLMNTSVEAAQRVRGVLLFRLSSGALPDQVAIGLGDGRTVELAASVPGIGSSDATRWTHAAMVPLISYGRPL